MALPRAPRARFASVAELSGRSYTWMRCGGSSAVELLPSKQDVAGSNPVPRSRFIHVSLTRVLKRLGLRRLVAYQASGEPAAAN